MVCRLVWEQQNQDWRCREKDWYQSYRTMSYQNPITIVPLQSAKLHLGYIYMYIPSQHATLIVLKLYLLTLEQTDFNTYTKHTQQHKTHSLIRNKVHFTWVSHAKMTLLSAVSWSSHLQPRIGSLWAWNVCTLFILDCQYLTTPLSSVVAIHMALWLHSMLRTELSWD